MAKFIAPFAAASKVSEMTKQRDVPWPMPPGMPRLQALMRTMPVALQAA